MSEKDALVISFALLVTFGVLLFLALSREWQAARALAVAFCVAYGLVLGQALGAVLEIVQ